LVAPGPEVTISTPGFPVDLAYPSAACPAPLFVTNQYMLY